MCTSQDRYRASDIIISYEYSYGQRILTYASAALRIPNALQRIKNNRNEFSAQKKIRCRASGYFEHVQNLPTNLPICHQVRRILTHPSVFRQRSPTYTYLLKRRLANFAKVKCVSLRR